MCANIPASGLAVVYGSRDSTGQSSEHRETVSGLARGHHYPEDEPPTLRLSLSNPPYIFPTRHAATDKTAVEAYNNSGSTEEASEGEETLEEISEGGEKEFESGGTTRRRIRDRRSTQPGGERSSGSVA